MDSDGKTAMMAGTRLEVFVANLLNDVGYDLVSARLFKPMKGMEQPIYARHYDVGMSVYDTPRKADFILYHPEKWQDCLVIDCKWQQEGGTVDEKYPYAVLNIQQSAFDSIILLDGKGYRAKAEAWLRGQVAKTTRLKHVFTMREFKTYANKGNLG